MRIRCGLRETCNRPSISRHYDYRGESYVPASNVGALLGVKREGGSGRISFHSPARSPYVPHSTSSVQPKVPQPGAVGAIALRTAHRLNRESTPMDRRARIPRRSRRTMAPSLDPLEARQPLSAAPVHVHAEPPRHHRAAVDEKARHAHPAWVSSHRDSRQAEWSKHPTRCQHLPPHSARFQLPFLVLSRRVLP